LNLKTSTYSSEIQFLSLEENHWGKCLTDSLLFLKMSWSSNWLGLDKVILLIINFLHKQKKNQIKASSQAQLMLEIAKHLALLIEQEARINPERVDHPYHNRLHFAQVMVSVAIQCMIESRTVPDSQLEWVSCLLLCAAGHDYKHTGSVNQKPQEIELLKVESMTPIFLKFGLSDQWQNNVKEIVLNTDVLTSRSVHSRVKDSLFNWNTDWASVLLIESDNMASCHPLLGPDLSQDLSKEWMKLDSPPDRNVATVEGRQKYLKGVIFTSLSSQKLGIKEFISQQLMPVA